LSTFRFIHSADWQLGARFCQFGPQAEALRQARLQTLATALQAASQRCVDAFLVAGDLFEDNQVD
jgi:DNA repair exonuclease SbcCD nuclease subunit